MGGGSVEALIGETVRAWNAETRIASIQPLTPDASLRRYFRVRFTDQPKASASRPSSAVAMIFDSVTPAEAGKAGIAAAVNSDEAYVALSQFFEKHEVAVPKLYYDGRQRSILLIEDLGDCLLGTMIVGENSGRFSGAERERVYRAAIDQLLRIQRIPSQNDFFPFQRRFDQSLYLKEMSEFTEFFLPQFSPSASDLNRCQAFFKVLAQEVDGLPYTLTHRDFHSWNLMLDPSNRLRVIDFQDALLAPKLYDLAALLNDRDTDSALGGELSQKLRRYYFETSGYGSSFDVDYHQVLLQRDLKVVGRFAKLVSQRGLTSYGRWIPGTLQRVRQGLEFLINSGGAPSYQDFFVCLESLIPADQFRGPKR